MTTTLEHEPAALAPLREHARDVHSQNGEDGIIEEIFRRLGELDRSPDQPLWCVEFGAWDGVHLSNTRHLIEAHEAHAVLIEPGEERYRELVDNSAHHAGVTTINSTVESTGERTLDTLLARTDCPERFDLLSIDVDGNDYWVWHAVRAYTPTVVVIEYNPTIPYEDYYPTPRDPRARHGSSLRALRELGQKKGYTLAAVTETNAIFVRTDRFDELRIADTSTRALTEGLTDYRTFLFVTPEGRVRVSGNRVMMWHGLVFDEAAMQQLPAPLRRHHDSYNAITGAILRFLAKRSRRRYERMLAREQRDWEIAEERVRSQQRRGTP